MTLIDASKLRILVVDDEPAVGDTVKMLLSMDGHEVETANSSQEALGKFESGRFDLVFTDFAMPGMNGHQLAAAIKAGAPDQPVGNDYSLRRDLAPVTRRGFCRQQALPAGTSAGSHRQGHAGRKPHPLREG